jgi:Uncharacterized protein containing LysM domain
MFLGLKKAMFVVEGEETSPINVMFNPKEYKVTRSVKKSDKKVPGKDKHAKQFVYGENDSLSLTLFFDTYSTGITNMVLPEAMKKDVRKETGKIVDLTDTKEHLHKPPKVKFVWGEFKFEGYIVSITQNFTMFTYKGVPVRATLDVTMEGEELEEKTKSSPDRTKSHTLIQGERLWQLADREYGDPSLWREIARTNNIDNPRKIKEGVDMKIPSL